MHRLLDRIMYEILLELGVPGHGVDALLVMTDCRKHVPCVLHSVHITNLIAVVCGNGNLDDPEALVMQLDDDLGVEVESVGHLRHVDLA